MEKEELEVLIEIRDFFRRHKQEIAKELGESDNALREALKDVKDTSYYSITELKRQIVEQSEAFKDIINEERDAFIDVSNTMKTQFDKQVKAYPSIAERLDDMAEMPHKLDVLVNKMEQYNWQLVENVNNMIRRIDQRREAAQERQNRLPAWLRIMLAICIPLITICSIVTMIATVAIFK